MQMIHRGLRAKAIEAYMKSPETKERQALRDYGYFHAKEKRVFSYFIQVFFYTFYSKSTVLNVCIRIWETQMQNRFVLRSVN